MKWSVQMPLFDAVVEGGAGGAGTGTGAGGGGTAAAPTGTGAAAGAGAQGDQASTGTGTGQQPTGVTKPPAFTYEQDRSNWVPPHRFREVSQQAQSARELQARFDQAQAQIRALTGVAPKDPNAAGAEQVRGAFKEMFPHLAKLDDARIDKLIRLAENSDQIESTTSHYWQTVGQQMVGSVHEGVADALGIDKLTPSQERRVAQAYVSMLHDDFQQARSEGRQSTLLQRHEARDPKLIEEFVKAFTDDFIEPVRRRTVQANVDRVTRRVPSGRGSSNAPITTKPKVDFINEQAVEDAAVESFRAHGGAFRR